VASTLAPILILLLAGYAARKLGAWPDAAADALNRFVVHICVPATILRLIPTLTLESELVVLVVVPWAIAAVAFVLSSLVARLLRLDRATATVLWLCTALGNTSFLGFPMCAALLGESSVALAAVYDQLGSFLMLSSLGIVAVARASGGEAPTARELARRTLTFPPFVALLLALVPVPHPVWLDDALHTVSKALVPTAMFAVGLRTRITPPAEWRVLAIGLTTKLVLLPGIVFVATPWLGISGELRAVAVLETAMPAMITAALLAMGSGLAPSLAAAHVAWGIVLSLVTLPLWATLLR
jgi:predicted permease